METNVYFDGSLVNDFSGLSPLSLTNDRHDAPPLSVQGEAGKSVGHSSSSVSSPVSTTPSVSAFYAENWLEGSDDQRRNYLRNKLRHAGFRVYSYNSGFWRFIDSVKDVVADEVGLVDKHDPDYPDFKRYNFKNCYTPRQQGVALKDAKGNWKVKKFNCGCGYCFFCRDRKRQELSAKRVDVLGQLKGKGVDKVWRLQATVPKEKAEMLFVDFKLVAKLRKKYVDCIKRAFGVKTRCNMAIDAVFHPLGDGNIMELHPHFHFVVYPFYLVKKDGGGYDEKIVDVDKLDLGFLKAEWNRCLFEVFGVEFGANQPQVKYHNISGKKGEKQCRHGLRYDFRSFSKDFEKQVVFFVDGGVVVKGKKFVEGEKVEYWRGVGYEGYARQWMMLCDWNVVAPYGWLHNMNKWCKEGVFKKEEKEVDDVEGYPHVEVCEVNIVRKKVYCNKKKKVVWRRELWAWPYSSRVWLKVGSGKDCDAGFFRGNVGVGVKLIERVGS